MYICCDGQILLTLLDASPFTIGAVSILSRMGSIYPMSKLYLYVCSLLCSVGLNLSTYCSCFEPVIVPGIVALPTQFSSIWFCAGFCYSDMAGNGDKVIHYLCRRKKNLTGPIFLLN